VSIRIAIADDHQMVIDGLTSILQNLEGVELKGQANNGREIIRLVENLKIDLVFMDIDMPEMDGIEATKQIKTHFPEVKIVILTMHDEQSLVKKLLEIGADGYILKNSSKTELEMAIRQIQSGKKHFSSEVTMILLEEESPAEVNAQLKQLTEREIEILKLISEGLSNKEIGDQLFISHRTVDTHRTNLMKKLDVHNVAGLIRFAIKNGLVE
jgi:two-component system response regulator NreC